MQPKMSEDSQYPTYLCSSAPIPCERCEGYSDQNRFDRRFTFVRKEYHNCFVIPCQRTPRSL